MFPCVLFLGFQESTSEKSVTKNCGQFCISCFRFHLSAPSIDGTNCIQGQVVHIECQCSKSYPCSTKETLTSFLLFLSSQPAVIKINYLSIACCLWCAYICFACTICPGKKKKNGHRCTSKNCIGVCLVWETAESWENLHVYEH